MKIGLFTDIHYRAILENGALDPDLSLGAGLDHINKHVPDLDMIVITGDLAHEGEIDAYRKLNDRLKTTATKTKLLLGNHDNREHFLQVFPNTQTDENGFVQSYIDLPQHRLVFLDTLNGPPYKYPSSHMGFLCEHRLAWLDNVLSSAGNKACIVFMHHPPHKVGFVAMDAIRLMNGDAFYQLVERHSNVKHIFCGHVHRNISGSHRGIPFTVFKSTVGQMPMLFDVMDFEMECFDPPAYGLIELSNESVLVHTEDFGVTDLDAVKAGLARQ